MNKCTVAVCNPTAVYMHVMLLLCICVLRCGVGVCNAVAVYLCATLRR